MTESSSTMFIKSAEANMPTKRRANPTPGLWVSQSTANDKKRDNESHQNQIKESFRHFRSAELFGFLARYGVLTRDQIAALFRTTCSNNFCKINLQELNDCGYLKIERSNVMLYRLSDKAFLNPKTDRPKPNDVTTEELIAAITGLPTSEIPKGRKRPKRKAVIAIEARELKKASRVAKKRNESMIEIKGPVSTLPQTVFRNDGLLGEIVQYLDAESILFSMLYLSGRVQSILTHDHAVRCVMSTKSGKRRLLYHKYLIQQRCIYTPSPIRMLRIGMGKRCERCNSKKTNTLNGLGLFLCHSCTQGITTEVKLRGEQSEEMNSLIGVAINDKRCSKVVRSGWKKNRKLSRHFMHSGPAPFLDSGTEKSGPLVSLTNLTAASSKSFGEIYKDACAGDHYRNKIPSILQAVDGFVQKYIHLGILDHRSHSSGWKIRIQWKNGDRTWESLTDFAEDDFETCLSYARENNLLDKPGWRWLRR